MPYRINDDPVFANPKYCSVSLASSNTKQHLSNLERNESIFLCERPLFRLFIPAVVPRDLSSLPPEYEYYREFFAPFQDPKNPPPADILMQLGILIAGNPDEVEANLRQQIEESTSGHILTWHHFGDLSYDSVRRSEELFATKVAPNLRSFEPALV